METTQITVAATINAEIPQVWEYYTAPEHITQWNFASSEWHCPHASNELVAGGTYMARMEARDGSMGFDFEGVYDEVIAHKKLSYNLTDGRNVTVIFKPLNKQTEVSLTFDAEGQNTIDMQRKGWQAILDNFKSFAEAQKLPWHES